MARRAIAVSVVLVAVGLGVYPASISAQTNVRVGYVNTTTILQQMPGFEAADSTIAAMRAGMQWEADSLQAQLASAVTGAEQQQLLLNPETGEAQFDSLQGLNDRIQARLEEMQTQVLARQRELVAPLQQQMRTAIEAIRAERGLAVVFDVANPNSAIFSVDYALDLTEVVLARLRGS